MRNQCWLLSRSQLHPVLLSASIPLTTPTTRRSSSFNPTRTAAITSEPSVLIRSMSVVRLYFSMHGFERLQLKMIKQSELTWPFFPTAVAWNTIFLGERVISVILSHIQAQNDCVWHWLYKYTYYHILAISLTSINTYHIKFRALVVSYSLISILKQSYLIAN